MEYDSSQTQELIDYNDEEHSYSVGGVNYPSVTTILREMGLFSNFYTKGSAEIGRAKHRLIADYLSGTIKWQNVSEEGYALIELLDSIFPRTGISDLWIERKFVNEQLGYAGGIDYQGLNETNKALVVVDWKTGNTKSDWHKIQIAAYAWATTVVSGVNCFVVYLGKNPKVVELTDEEYEYYSRVFSGMLETYKYKEKNKCLQKRR